MKTTKKRSNILTTLYYLSIFYLFQRFPGLLYLVSVQESHIGIYYFTALNSLVVFFTRGQTYRCLHREAFIIKGYLEESSHGDFNR